MSFDQVIQVAVSQLPNYNDIVTDHTSESALITLSRTHVACRLDRDYDEDKDHSRFRFYATARDSFGTYGKPRFLFGLPAEATIHEIGTGLAVAAKSQMDGTPVPSPWRWSRTSETRTTWFANRLSRDLTVTTALVKDTSLLVKVTARYQDFALFITWDGDGSFWRFHVRDTDGDELGAPVATFDLPAEVTDEDVTDLALYWLSRQPYAKPSPDAPFPLPRVGLTRGSNPHLVSCVEALHQSRTEVVRVHQDSASDSQLLPGRDAVAFRDGSRRLFLLTRSHAVPVRWRLYAVKHNRRVELDYQINEFSIFNCDSGDLFEEITLAPGREHDSAQDTDHHVADVVSAAMTTAARWVNEHRCPPYRFAFRDTVTVDGFDGFIRRVVTDELDHREESA